MDFALALAALVVVALCVYLAYTIIFPEKF
jgi:K+-transporting ATPase KdpF subunit